tara:strand:+ start:845 stop:1072 length:228 start_codon:yes stop_codon:yes gene_type:complete
LAALEKSALAIDKNSKAGKATLKTSFEPASIKPSLSHLILKKSHPINSKIRTGISVLVTKLSIKRTRPFIGFQRE